MLPTTTEAAPSLRNPKPAVLTGKHYKRAIHRGWQSLCAIENADLKNNKTDGVAIGSAWNLQQRD